MPVIFLEEILKQAGNNKYLAVHIAGKRARELNERSISMLMGDHRKPAAIALEELKAGKIAYEEPEEPTDAPEDFPFPPIDDDIEDGFIA